MSTGTTGTGLRRALGLRTVVSTSTGLAFAAIEYIVAAGLIGYVAGDAAPVAIAVAGLLLLLVWGCYGELNGLFPTAAAIRLYMARAMDDRVALTITFTYLTTIVLVVAADAFIIGSAIVHVLGGASWAAAAYVALLLALATLVNLRGIRVAGGVQDAATYAVVAGTIVLSLVALGRDGFALRTPLAPLSGGHGVLDFVEAVALGVFLYSAFEWVTTGAEEVRAPALIPRGMLIALGLLFVTCSLIAAGMSHLLPARELASPYPQLYMAQRAAGGVGVTAMLAITALTAVNTFNGGFITASRFMYATAREGVLPPMFARLNDRAVPYVPVLVLGGASLVVAVVVALTGAWQVLVAMGAALEAMIYAVAAYCVLRLRQRLPSQERPFRLPAARVLAPAAIVVFGLLGLTASVTVGNATNPLPLIILLVTAALSAAYVLLVIPRLRRAEEARRAIRGTRRPPRRQASS